MCECRHGWTGLCAGSSSRRACTAHITRQFDERRIVISASICRGGMLSGELYTTLRKNLRLGDLIAARRKTAKTHPGLLNRLTHLFRTSYPCEFILRCIVQFEISICFVFVPGECLADRSQFCGLEFATLRNLPQPLRRIESLSCCRLQRRCFPILV